MTFIEDPTDQIQEICTNISFLSRKQKVKSILVTSSEAGEGKTTLASRVAKELSHNNKRILIVDANFNRPTLTKKLKLMGRQGFYEAITDSNQELSSLVFSTQLENLWVMPVGNYRHIPNLGLYDKQLASFSQMLSSEFDSIIIDGPSLSRSTGKQLASSCDSVIMVIRQNQALKENVVKAQHELDIVNAKLLGYILNDIR